ncbi:SMI1/KNR4 family protein [Paenibacillus sp. GCM10028914]|uniref:SMI1/KNR4 family protein n=1 Tax=Paenibacillus sp. GCM10028914 TaxID=3273416 RepID=UPI00361740F6
MKINDFEYSFPSVNMQDIELFEMKYDFSLPNDYKQFLLLSNGGKPGPRRRFITNDELKEGEVESSILLFFPLTDEVESNLEKKYQVYTNSNVIQKKYLPIGETPRNNMVCMVIDGDEKGSLYHFDMGYDDYLDKSLEVEAEHIRLITRSFNDFINGLFTAK